MSCNIKGTKTTKHWQHNVEFKQQFHTTINLWKPPIFIPLINEIAARELNVWLARLGASEERITTVVTRHFSIAVWKMGTFLLKFFWFRHPEEFFWRQVDLTFPRLFVLFELLSNGLITFKLLVPHLLKALVFFYLLSQFWTINSQMLNSCYENYYKHNLFLCCVSVRWYFCNVFFGCQAVILSRLLLIHASSPWCLPFKGRLYFLLSLNRWI